MSRQINFKTYASHKVLNYLTRMMNAPLACRVAFLVLTASFLNAFLSVIATVVGAIYLLLQSSQRKAIFSDTINIITSFFIIMTLVVGLVYGNVVGTFACLFFACLFVLMASLRAVITRRHFEDLITCYLVYSVFAVAVAIIEKLLNSDNALYRTCSTFLNPLYYSYFVALAAVMATYRLVVSTRAKLVHSLVLIANILGMFLSGGRLPWMGMFLGCLAVLLLCKRYKLMLVFSAVIGVMVLLAALFPDVELFATLRLSSIDSGYNMRIPYWKRAIECFEQSPVAGQGFLAVLNSSIGDNLDLFSQFFKTFNLADFFADMKSRGWMLHAHNILFDLISCFGILGTLMLLFCIIRYLSKMYRNFDHTSSQPMIALMVGFICTLCVGGILDCYYIGAQTSVFTVILFSATGLKKEKEYDKFKADITLEDINSLFKNTLQRKG